MIYQKVATKLKSISLRIARIKIDADLSDTKTCVVANMLSLYIQKTVQLT